MSNNSGGAEQYTTTVDSASTTVTFTRPSRTVMVVNCDDTDFIQVSFDGGTSWTRVFPLSSMQFDMGIASFQVRAMTASAAAATASIDVVNVHGR